MKKLQQLPQKHTVLSLIICASTSAPLVYKLIQEAQQAEWDVYAYLAPQAHQFVDPTLLEQLTDHPVRDEEVHSEEPDTWPQADAIIVFPATIDLLYAWAFGTHITFVARWLAHYTGHQLPIVVVPSVKTGNETESSPDFLRSVDRLKQSGIDVIYEPHHAPSKQHVSPHHISERLRHASIWEF